MPDNSQDEIKTITQVCLALISHIVATEAVVCQLDSGAREKLKAALIASKTGKMLTDKGKMLDEATARDLSQTKMRMPLQLDELLTRLS